VIPSTPVIVSAAILGLLIGSFLNVVVWRVPRKESLNHPASHCPKCGHPIRFYDNIPVVSWLVLRGKCRDCGAPISWRYPAVEAGTALAFGAVTWFAFSEWLPRYESLVAFALVLVAFLYLAAVSIALTLIDLDVNRLPNSIVLPSYGVGAVLLGAAGIIEADGGALLRTAIAAVALFAVYFVMALAYPGGMGFGDVKLAGVLGLFLGWLGWGTLAVGAFAAFVLGGLFGLVLLLARRAGRKTRIPFGPWMLGGAWVGVFFGEQIARWYLGLFGLA
jgi:leader peptidase (prepilin peptidase)/N-methyltransferase